VAYSAHIKQQEILEPMSSLLQKEIHAIKQGNKYNKEDGINILQS
jgi:hypothetical protein